MNEIITYVDFYYLEAKPFAERDIYILNNMVLNNISCSNIVKNTLFANIKFDSSKHDKWIITPYSMYQKKLTNGIVFILDEDNVKYNPRQYKYLIIFQNITKVESSYGFLWVKDNQSLARFAIEYIHDEIIHQIIKDLNFWKIEKLYSAIYQEPKISLKEYNKVYKEYVETYRWKNFEEWENLIKTPRI